MFKIELDASELKDFADKAVKQIQKDIRTKVIENGMDKELSRSVAKLKTDLLNYINKEVKEPNKVQTKGNTPDQINVPKSDEDLMKFLFGIDVSKINKNKDHTTSVDSNVFFIKDNRVRLRIPEGPDGNMEQSYQKALETFRNAVFVDVSTPQPKYYLNNQFDTKPFTKIVCSRDAGVTDNSKKTYDSYKNSNKRTRHLESPLGRFSEWTMYQDGVKKLMKDSINITEILENIKNGEYERAIENYRRLNMNKSATPVEQKLEDLKNNSNLTPDVETHKNIVALIKNLKISKNISKDVVTYSLISSYNEEGDTFVKFYDEIIQKISLWTITNDTKWFNHIIKVIKGTIGESLKGIK